VEKETVCVGYVFLFIRLFLGLSVEKEFEILGANVAVMVVAASAF